MELKDYQQKALTEIKNFLEKVVNERSSGNAKHACLDAWGNVGLTGYKERKNGLGEDLPNFCMKIPTGGGKTLLAVKTIDLLNTVYRKKNTGLILWVVPTNQIYSQTIKNLRNREHPYRQHLDIASGGRTMILEKTDRIISLDVQENLVIMMLMLPSANRKVKEVLRIFKDNGGFQDFFPAEDKKAEHEELLVKFPNLDTFGKTDSFWGRQIKTSLGNTLRLLNPVIILDEGHKAYSESAQETLYDFNPSVIVELSATPSTNSNVLVDIRGAELNAEGMIKLDLHVYNKVSPQWKDTLLDSIEKRNKLEKTAIKHKASTGNYIRPIILIQVERTGKDQRGGRFIHSEDVREYLITVEGIPEEQVAVTSAELKELEGHDLLSPECPIRYIITKQALQEGWDCPFAYVLTVLTNPQSENALTQLVGRILRQPMARKTKIKDLDESYVFTYKQNAAGLIAKIKKGLEQEGLGDLGNLISPEEGTDGQPIIERDVAVRRKFAKAIKETILPVFVIKEGKSWRKVKYETDIVSRIKWSEAYIAPLYNLNLSPTAYVDNEHIISLDKEEVKQIEAKHSAEHGIELDPVFLTRHLIEVVPNPWIAHEIGQTVVKQLSQKNKPELIAGNAVFIIEEIKKHLLNERDRLAEGVFRAILKSGELRFMVISNTAFRMPDKIVTKSISPTLCKSDGMPVQKSLFDYVPMDEFNETEKTVALYLEDQDRLFCWYRNRPKQDYGIQGWRKNVIYPDFIFTKSKKDSKESFSKVYMVETKGIHLKNEDTDYKKAVFELCNLEAKELDWHSLGKVFDDKELSYEVVYEDEWKNKFNEYFAK